VAEENGIARGALQGTTQNDIIKEFLSRGTYAFPPEPSMRLVADTIAFTIDEVPRWNPVNICSYHLQEAGATPVQEIAYSMSTAVAVLDRVRSRVPDETFPRVFGRISFFVNAGIRFVEEHAKLRAMGRIWEELGRERYGVDDDRLLRFRYGVQVNSLGLTEAQPENNIIRIVLEALGVTLGRSARARALQLPAWNEALGLPRPWDQQWSLRIQQILAYETDLLEYPDIFEGSKVMEGLVAELVEGARAEMAVVEEHGGAVEAALLRLQALPEWVEGFDGSRRALAALKTMTSGLIGRFARAADEATRARYGDGPLTRHAADLVVPEDTLAEVVALKAVAAHYVMSADERLPVYAQQQELLAELVDALLMAGGQVMQPPYAADLADAADDDAALRVVVDQVAALTDTSAVVWHRGLVG